ncbi:MAG TPA: aminoglycoside phosphotransferase family protein [Chitinophagaceae bacterium]|nr:aminoglycoside phosphotransferase family protein [Chitinophagaceae bacterium]
MLEEVCKAYRIDLNKYRILPTGNGLINSTWLIENPSQQFILQKVNDKIFKKPYDIAQNIRMIADYLSSHYPGYLFAAPIKTTDGNEMKYLSHEGYFRLFPFIHGSVTIDTVQNPQQAYEAAKKFGEFTRLLSGFEIDTLKITLPDFHNLSLRYQHFTDALQSGNKKTPGRSKPLIDFIIANKNILDTYETILKNPSFKLRVTHHDTKISNILFDRNDKGLCVIDLDTVMPGYFISDVGDMFRTYLSPVNEEEKDFSQIEIREEYFKAIWNGYLSEMNDELSKEEKEHFIYAGKFLIYMQAIRFLTDYINNDVYYATKYEGQNFVRAANQVALLQKLTDKEPELKRLID